MGYVRSFLHWLLDIRYFLRIYEYTFQKGGYRTLSIRIRVRHVFSVFLKSNEDSCSGQSQCFLTNQGFLLHDCFSFTSRLPQLYLAIISALSRHYLSFTSRLPQLYLTITSALPHDYLSFTQPLSQLYLAFISALPHDYIRFTSRLPRDYLYM